MDYGQESRNGVIGRAASEIRALREKKIVVPDGMLKSGIEAVQDGGFDRYRVFLEAALRWLSENPILPGVGFGDCILAAAERAGASRWPELSDWERAERLAAEWQRMMFLEPPPNPIVESAKRNFEGCTFTEKEADELIECINQCTPPRRQGKVK